MVLAQQVGAVVAAIGRANDGVDVHSRRLVIIERNAALVVANDLGERRVSLWVGYTPPARNRGGETWILAYRSRR